MTVYSAEVGLVVRGSHRRARPAAERWWWFLLVTSPAWLQVALLPVVGGGTPVYNGAVIALGIGFLVYLGYFAWNRRRHARMRRFDGTGVDTGAG
ncbi:MAG: hypothetical protein QOE76_2775 [Frankiales bacterium]|jgi:hypothetical protein|nr:hypothetical protein [Frankiales bacterium]